MHQPERENLYVAFPGQKLVDGAHSNRLKYRMKVLGSSLHIITPGTVIIILSPLGSLMSIGLASNIFLYCEIYFPTQAWLFRFLFEIFFSLLKMIMPYLPVR